MKRRLMTVAAAMVFGIAGLNMAVAGSDDMTPFTTEELKAFLNDKSYPLGGRTLKKSKGALYFHEDGTLDATWKGKKETATWTVEDDSKFCYKLNMFGTKECVQLMKSTEDGGYVHIFDGQHRNLSEDAIVSGKQF